MTTTFKGTPIILAGQFPQAGDDAPAFYLVRDDMSEFTLKDGKGHYLILNIFPSLDTGVCATTVRRFNKMAASLPGALVLCISKDLITSSLCPISVILPALAKITECLSPAVR